MNYKITESITKFGMFKSILDFFNPVFSFLAIIVLVPFIFISWAISLFKKNNANEFKFEWTSLKSLSNLNLYRLDIDESDLPENLDYPEDTYDFYLTKIKSEPFIQGLQDMFFDTNFAETNSGIYLISYNESGKGMTLWCIDKLNLNLHIVKELQPLDWNLTRVDDDTILLKAVDKKNKYNYIITSNS